MNQSPDTPRDDTAVIRDLNDRLRQRLEGGQVFITPGIANLADATVAKIMQAIQAFDDFNEDNDPYQTHEFGSVKVDGETVFFKVDAYDKNLEYGSPNPADPEVTTRVMTILLAAEY